MANFIPLDEPGSAAPATGCALWNLGFRPLYLLAALFAASAMAIWVARFGGWLGSGEYLANSLWHAHEMIFGYTFAVVVGFLFTAVRNWTAQPTPSGKPLAAIVALWVAARLLLSLDFPLLATLCDAAFAIAAAWGVGRPIRASGNRRNAFFVPLLLAIGVVNLVCSLAILGRVDLPPRTLLALALDLILIVMTVIGGRVIPMFTANAVPQAKPARQPWLERTAIGAIVALLVVDALAAPAPIVSLVAGVAAFANGARLALWQPWRTLRRPILWILHLSYAWIVVHLALRSGAAWAPDIGSLAAHALTVGGIGGLTLGMMTRTARGHTGRPLIAGRMEVLCYGLVQIAAAVRVLVPLALPSCYMNAAIFSGALWVASFLLFAGKYAPFLWRPRIDGKPG